MIRYLNDIKGDAFEIARTATVPANRSVSGYGAKIPTQYVAIDLNDHRRRRRVYAICYSNAASLYILIGGLQYFLRDSDIPEKPRVIGLPDSRYSVTLEHCGQVEPRFILRFCGEWVSWHYEREKAEEAANEHFERRRSA